MLTSTSRPPSSRAASIHRRRDRRVGDVAGDGHHARGCRAAGQLVADAIERRVVSARQSPGRTLARPARGRSPRPARGSRLSRAPPDSIQSYVRSIEKASIPDPDPIPTPVNRVQLQVHLKSSGNCVRLRRAVLDRLRPMSDVLTIGEVAARSGVATSALRFYEEQRLIHPERNDSGHRRYPRAVLRLVAFIVFAQKVGLSLDEIRAELAKLPRNRVPERADWAKLSGRMENADSRAHRRARAPGGGPQRVHRLRLPVARSVPAGESRRSRGAPRLGSALLDGIRGWQGPCRARLRGGVPMRRGSSPRDAVQFISAPTSGGMLTERSWAQGSGVTQARCLELPRESKNRLRSA